MYTIGKSFDFCYGHRVYSQSVNIKYSIDDANPCRRIHGHQGNVSIVIESERLDTRGFVIDFKELTFIKKFINDNLDHRFILSYDDPRFEQLACTDVESVKKECSPITLIDDIIMGWRNHRIELDSFVFVNFNPTSEALAEWIYNGVQKAINRSPFKCNVKEVIWSETPKTKAIYNGTV